MQVRKIGVLGGRKSVKTRIRKTSQVRRQETGRLQRLKQGTLLFYVVRAGDFNKDFKTVVVQFTTT